MALFLLVTAIIMFACIIANRISGKLGIPMLLAFILVGMLFGSDGIFKISFDNYELAEKLCVFALVFIMFYGGFGTKWQTAKPVAIRASLLSSVGTMLTAIFIGLFCNIALKIELIEGLILGSVISSTDAATVFSILRGKKLNLKDNTASLLELESGSNDPFAYMLTVIFLTIKTTGTFSVWNVVLTVVLQVVLGVLFGVLISYLAILFFKKFKFESSGFNSIFLVVVAVLSYATPETITQIFGYGGNGFLSAYISGIILGNVKIKNKNTLVSFFDALTGIMQMLLFFVLGLLSFPSKLPGVALYGLIISLFLTLIARPFAVFMVLTPFKCNIRQQLLVSISGMRGAASIVFAIMTITGGATLENDLFHIVFFIVLFSILLQGSLLPKISKLLNMTDESQDVMKTFTDYADEIPVQFIKFTVPSEHEYVGKKVSEISLPPDCILVLAIKNGKKHIPTGRTVIGVGDVLVLSGNATDKSEGISLYERTIEKGDVEVDQKIKSLTFNGKFIVMIRRGGKAVIPRGETKLLEGDVLVINDMEDN